MENDPHLIELQTELLRLSERLIAIDQPGSETSAAALVAMIKRVAEIEIDLVGIAIFAV